MALLARISNLFLDAADAAPPTPAPADVTVDPEVAFAELRAAIEPARKALLDHPLYRAVDSLPRLRAFMATHVFAVWDFMCLAKRLQRDLTSMEPLWRPPAMPEMARFINGVILGEESDDGPDHEAISHCELYIGAMDEVGAPTDVINRFIGLITDGVDVDVALTASAAPRAARTFVRRTLATALDGDTVEVLASFLFGREDLIPEMFSKLLPRWQASRSAKKFTYYVKRHIELDGDEHGPAARKALMSLAGRDPQAWRAARRAAEDAIAARLALWDRVLAEIS
ncbi:MAG: DUF3050 domain-containing protein [Deltaproteobacteria bacterium]|nr:DUF3050 domain-containing protein [Deltaproteobacteria bacterium]